MRPIPHYMTKRERGLVVIALREQARAKGRIAARLTDEPGSPGRLVLALDHLRDASEYHRLAALFLHADVDIYPLPKN
jgi:hypothetical protein